MSRSVWSFGAQVLDEGVRFRLWAPVARDVQLSIEGGARLPMIRNDRGWYELSTLAARDGTKYRYEVDGLSIPDPASHYQPRGIDGSSEVVDASAYQWRDGAWQGKPWPELVIYELHPGTFSEGGDFAGIADKLDHLVNLGITAIEIMPVAECPGRWNWGYDGVLPYAVEERYGGPEALKRLVDACHERGVAVLLDVVYNHFGPDGNYLHAYAPGFFTEKHKTPWGAAINFDDRDADIVRSFFIENALYWLREYHLDGLRFDAVHAIRDDSKPDVVVELGQRIRKEFGTRPIHLILENDANRADVLGAQQNGPGPHTAQWNDDFHHALRVAITGNTGGYYSDYADQPLRHLARLLAEGFAYQGEASAHRNNEVRGQLSASLPPTAFVSFIQNHDQVGNHAYGWRLPHFASNEAIRAAVTILLLSPQIPMLWMGEEWQTDQPFPFFCDFQGELADAVRKGRAEEFSSFPEFRDPEARKSIPDPLSEATFRSALLDWNNVSQPKHRAWLETYRELIALRREYVVPRLSHVLGNSGTYSLPQPTVINVQWRFGDGAVLQLVANLSDQAASADVGEVVGRSLFATAPLSGEQLPPWYVAVNLQDQEGDAA